jgi:polyisoprenoid-binding protein YceI
MMKLMRLCLPLWACAALLTGGESIPAQQKWFVIDPAQTHVEFEVGSTLHTIHGSFHLTRGDLRFEPGGGKASGELVVDAASGDSGSKSRDKRMNSAILEAVRFPQVVFRPVRVEGTVAGEGHSELQLRGIFSIHGAEHEMLVPLVVEAKDGQYTVTGMFSVPYVKWGMKNPSTLMLRVNDKVEITVHAVAHPGT